MKDLTPDEARVATLNRLADWVKVLDNCEATPAVLVAMGPARRPTCVVLRMDGLGDDDAAALLRHAADVAEGKEG